MFIVRMRIQDCAKASCQLNLPRIHLCRLMKSLETDLTKSESAMLGLKPINRYVLDQACNSSQSIIGKFTSSHRESARGTS